jgi:hypothetical protein
LTGTQPDKSLPLNNSTASFSGGNSSSAWQRGNTAASKMFAVINSPIRMVYSRAGSGDGRFSSVGLVAPQNRNYRQFVEQLFDSLTDGGSVAYFRDWHGASSATTTDWSRSCRRFLCDAQRV